MSESHFGSWKNSMRLSHYYPVGRIKAKSIGNASTSTTLCKVDSTDLTSTIQDFTERGRSMRKRFQSHMSQEINAARTQNLHNTFVLSCSVAVQFNEQRIPKLR